MWAPVPSSVWDHPRIRGENSHRLIIMWLRSGSPPHTRGKLCFAPLGQVSSGITPAYAGKIQADNRERRYKRDHPRILGENPPPILAILSFMGSPPHTRGKSDGGHGGLGRSGITPAYAGKISRAEVRSSRVGDHPRIRGENVKIDKYKLTDLGSPPHTRGKC